MFFTPMSRNFFMHKVFLCSYLPHRILVCPGPRRREGEKTSQERGLLHSLHYPLCSRQGLVEALLESSYCLGSDYPVCRYLCGPGSPKETSWANCNVKSTGCWQFACWSALESGQSHVSEAFDCPNVSGSAWVSSLALEEDIHLAH